jgi:hypothetical protein
MLIILVTSSTNRESTLIAGHKKLFIHHKLHIISINGCNKKLTIKCGIEIRKKRE